MTTFGELIEESSRAFPDDEDELNPDWAPEFVYESQSADLDTGSSSSALILFHGKLATGFGEGYLTENNNFIPIGTLSIATGDVSEGVPDSMLKRKPGNSRPIIRLYKNASISVVFGFIDTYGVPRSLANQIIEHENISRWIQGAEKVVIFHSENNGAIYRGFGGFGGEEGNNLYYLKTSIYQEKTGKEMTLLPQPNLISGVSAAVLTICEAVDKSCILLINYNETELVDSLSIQPFLQYAKEIMILGKLTFSLKNSTKKNLSHVTESTNLYT